ncbi:DUF177 domain-containing protein [Candidatus Sumerlaeota bacterium]|nr:DUF177 domain-containing protein [Candidatus Sumerlaeota bacterium]
MNQNTKTSRLKFETERLKSGPITYDIVEAAHTFDLLKDPDFVFDEPFQLHLTLSMIGQTVLMRGTIATIAKSPCSRCLEPLRVALHAEVSITFMQDERLLDTAKYPELIDDDTHWYDGESIYPAEQLRELLLLELPPNPGCELDDNDICPIRNVKVEPQVFGAAEADAPAAATDENSFAAQLRKLRRGLDG